MTYMSINVGKQPGSLCEKIKEITKKNKSYFCIFKQGECR